ncbi:MAG: hypothetical protein JWO69_1750 [Thermoleophilia bacterium]|nr:hypothetical protein [Thermoleophilia bacterium]
MPEFPRHRPTFSPARPHACERAQSLVEVVVVLIIIGILMAVLVGAGRSSSEATETQSTLSIAHVYADAVEAFADEHGGRAPVIGTNDWPTRATGVADRDAPATQPAFAGGPRNLAAAGRRYLRRVPEPVMTGAVGLRTLDARGAVHSAGNSSSRNRLTYASSSGTAWRIDVERNKPTRTGSPSWTVVCSMGTAPTAGARRC